MPGGSPLPKCCTYLLNSPNEIEAEKARSSKGDQLRHTLCKHWHHLSHLIRDFATNMRLAQTHDEADQQIAQTIVGVLNIASTVFGLLTKHDCTASLMLFQPNTELLETVSYSYNAPADRASHKSQPLSSRGGVVGRAFTRKDVVTWKRGDADFVPIRPDGQQFYTCGVVIPFQVGCKYAGVLNIDSVEDVFSHSEHKQPGCALADAIGIILEISQIHYEDRKSLT